jgi:hypothetical protein
VAPEGFSIFTKVLSISMSRTTGSFTSEGSNRGNRRGKSDHICDPGYLVGVKSVFHPSLKSVIVVFSSTKRRFTCKGDRLRENGDGYYNPQNLSLSAAHRAGCYGPLREEIF